MLWALCQPRSKRWASPQSGARDGESQWSRRGGRHRGCRVTSEVQRLPLLAPSPQLYSHLQALPWALGKNLVQADGQAVPGSPRSDQEQSGRAPCRCRRARARRWVGVVLRGLGVWFIGLTASGLAVPLLSWSLEWRAPAPRTEGLHSALGGQGAGDAAC